MVSGNNDDDGDGDDDDNDDRYFSNPPNWNDARTAAAELPESLNASPDMFEEYFGRITPFISSFWT